MLYGFSHNLECIMNYGTVLCNFHLEQRPEKYISLIMIDTYLYHILRNFLGPQKVGPWTYLVYCVIYSHYQYFDLRTLSRQNMNQVEFQYYMYITILYIYTYRT